MQVGVLGLNHKSAKSLSLREKISQICRNLTVPGIVVVSTCHRTEIYFSGNDLAGIQSQLFSILKEQTSEITEHAFYSFFGEECLYHLTFVTAGLDSAMLAETDIQRQVKVAYEGARIKGLSSDLHYLFQKALKIGKTARSTYPLFQTALHLEGVLFTVMRSLLGESAKVLFVGNSDINRKIIHYFWRRGQKQMTLCTQSLEAAYPFALDYQLTLKDRSELSQFHTYDVVIAATNTNSYLISELPSTFQTRLMFDLSVPRSIHPSLKKHPLLTHLDIEETGKFFEGLHQKRRSEVDTIKAFLRKTAAEYVSRYQKKCSNLIYD